MLDLKIVLLTFGEVLRFRDSQKVRKHAADPAAVPPRG